MQEFEEISGIIEKQIYKSSENGFSVFTLKISSKENVIIQGYLIDIFEGEQVTLSGKWVFHPKFGKQFQAKECIKKTPETVEGIKKYLSSGLIKGIGPKFAEKLVNAFGQNTLEVIDKTPDKLLNLHGVGPKKVDSIINAWQSQKEISKIMVFLKSKDISTSFAYKIYKQYGNDSITTVEQNPYRLVDDIWGVGFKSADQLALKLGLEKNSINRIKAGILFLISDQTNSGHLYSLVDKIKTDIQELLELEDILEIQALITKSLNTLYQEEKIKLITHQEKNYITLPKFYYSEKNIAYKILHLQERLIDKDIFDLDKIYNQIRKIDQNNIELNEDQQRGIISCFQNKVSIITGGPGTGKTTLVKKLIEVLDNLKQKYNLAAPTGRAAKRIFEGTGKNAETLHRLLEFNPSTLSFNKNELNALDLNFLIVDEASMIDVFLMNSLLKAIPNNAHLILLGDIDQLPSVGAGNILNDLINSEKVSVTKLTQIFRQAQDSLIIVNAHKVNHGQFPIQHQENSRHDFKFIKTEKPEDFFPILHEIYKTKLKEKNINPSDCIVLAPMNKALVGTQRINQELQLILNSSNNTENQISRFGTIYKVNDRVMQIKNNYEKFVFNGDIGFIKEIDQEEQKIFINFGERLLEYDFTELNELTLAYAVSIHKSQGSEFGAVIIPIFMQHFILLQRNLIYTAITRAKKLCILVGQTKAVAMAIKNNKSIKRNTFLKEFLTTDLQAR